MLRSMYAGISGLKNFQTKLDVIGNNISNVNTYGFKKGRTIFKDLYSQTVAGASAPSAARGGVNPKQVGLGSQLAAIDTLHTAGSTQFTGNTLDMAIEGDGFFVVKEGTTNMYTRAGNFYLDSGTPSTTAGTSNPARLVDGDGRFVMGYKADANGVIQGAPTTTSNGTLTQLEIPTDATNMSVGQDGTVNYVQNGVLKIAGRIAIANFNNPGGLEKVGGNLFLNNVASGNPSIGYSQDLGRGTIKSGSLEMSNVDLSEEFTEMIVAQRGFQANTRIITTSDEILQELVNLKR
ncbi:flagellar basal-body rod protein FlgG [Sporosarcina sp. NCCP-2716]|uniref:flagellar basal body rod protein FlgG n=1 Tax=Sporosarcina sp. NCCP-2716 TaxID=2943679 RepID=UPI00203DD4C2|nr:flagellar basal body rod protein FlgG [Sporosarcina sp. NCCP-2716]GKV67804.1 flagellar basal-body rod protein FlgG [Sporosarcina sp. NCCP-2716]